LRNDDGAVKCECYRLPTTKVIHASWIQQVVAVVSVALTTKTSHWSTAANRTYYRRHTILATTVPPAPAATILATTVPPAPAATITANCARAAATPEIRQRMKWHYVANVKTVNLSAKATAKWEVTVVFVPRCCVSFYFLFC
jgi:hypothetical protein